MSDDVLQAIQRLNHDLIIDLRKENGIGIRVTDDLSEQKYIELRFPEGFIPAENFEELTSNRDKLYFEQKGETIFIKMGTIYTIGLITMAIGASLYMWAKKNKTGRVLPENSTYQLSDSKTGKTEIRMADISYISYGKASESEQKKWGKNCPIAPTLSIEIVSSKYGLKPALWKMQYVWMQFGTDIGVVVCPFSKKLYIFEKGKSNHIEQSIYHKFTHTLLPDYEGDFSEYVDEISES
ncbi:MAG: Uma2 family endonuclease [Leptospiraceae bacterium]|nr:Uma2 family endonuclease [Leptospiraceae bacterium]